MPKSRLLNCSNNQLDDKEPLIPIQNCNDKKTGATSAHTQSAKATTAHPNNHHTTDVSTRPAAATTSTTTTTFTSPTTTTTTTTSTTATATGKAPSSRSMAKRVMSSTSASNVKPNTIMSMEDRDIIVIDNVDYKESTCNEGTVIVVEKPRKLHPKGNESDIDLAELLESNWPATAGDLALALNNPRNQSNGTAAAYGFSSGSTSTSNSSISGPGHGLHTAAYSHERNRSKNPLAHIGQAKVKRNTIGNLINLDSDGSSASGSYELNASKHHFQVEFVYIFRFVIVFCHENSGMFCVIF